MTDPNVDPIVAARYISLGEALHALRFEASSRIHWIVEHLNLAIATLDLLSLPYPNEHFDKYRLTLEKESLTIGPQSQMVFGAHRANELQNMISVAREIIFDAAEKRLTIALNVGGVSPKLAALPQQIAKLTPAQSSLFLETKRCLETGTYRSAAVMGWNMAYDYIRQWIFDNHLVDFNMVLTTNYTLKNGSPQYEPIVDYPDFTKNRSPGEGVVLDCCRTANKIGGNVHDDLKQHLRQRNEYAHPSGREPTPIQVNSYLENLVDLITGPTFN